jgi:lysophospholipase L1-like esterase
VARIGFASPLGLGDGLFAAKINSDGQLVPDTLVKAINPPFDVSPQPCAERAKLYELPGLARLCGKDSPLKDGMTIDFFGDSITWQNGYVGAIDMAIKNGEGTKSLHVKLVNRGINGGGVLQIRDGAEGAGFPGNTPQKPFAQLIAADKADLAVVYIGINDVTWRNTAPEVFEKALRDIVASAASGKTRLVLATLSVHCEMPDGTNSDDKKIDQYAQITRTVAQDTGTTLVDLRRGYIAYLQNHNAQLRVDGTLYIKPMGVLTYDGIHPNQHGVKLLAEMIGDGICRAQTARK